MMLYLNNILALNDGSKCITNLCHNNLDKLLRARAWDISVANGILNQNDIVPELCTMSSSGRHTNMCL